MEIVRWVLQQHEKKNKKVLALADVDIRDSFLLFKLGFVSLLSTKFLIKTL